jgi:rhodanese-related sulfurtransferase
MASRAPITISSLTKVTPSTLAASMLDPARASKVAVIDVRDSDHVGGHIKGSHWIPTNQLEARIPELIRVHSDKEQIIFHCMLSQQRGPSSALKFARALEDASNKAAKIQLPKKERPTVCVLEGGFGMWQAQFGEDERLTEAYAKDIWE